MIGIDPGMDEQVIPQGQRILEGADESQVLIRNGRVHHRHDLT